MYVGLSRSPFPCWKWLGSLFLPSRAFFLLLCVYYTSVQLRPYANPQESFEYYDALPFCAPQSERFNERAAQSLGEVLAGYSLRDSGYTIRFPPTEDQSLTAEISSCTTEGLDEAQVEAFAKAIRNRWFYQMFLDDLPVWGMVGELLPDATSADLVPYVYTKRNLHIRYNGSQILRVDWTSDQESLVKIQKGTRLTFPLQVHWEATSTHGGTNDFASRFDRYLDSEYFAHPMHIFSFVPVVILVVIVAQILRRTLHKDFARYGIIAASSPDPEDTKSSAQDPLFVNEENNESGWKQVHGDVFREPSYLVVFSVLVGVGMQFAVAILLLILFALAGSPSLHECRGGVLSAFLLFLSLANIFLGYTSHKCFVTYRPAGKFSPGGLAMTMLLSPAITVTIYGLLNGLGVVYGTTNIIPLVAAVKLFLLWIFVSVPLCFAGTLYFGDSDSKHFPCSVNEAPRPIPQDSPWYARPRYLVALAGFVIFCSTWMELSYVMTSLWSYKFYHVFGYLLCAFCMLVVVVGLVSITVVYVCLNSENYMWQWTAFGGGASTGVYVFVYGIYFFLYRSTMHGFYQTAYYFGCMTWYSIHFGIVCGAIAYGASHFFVRMLFRNLKME